MTPIMSVADDTETEEEESDEGFTGLVQVFRVFKLARILKLARYQVLNKGSRIFHNHREGPY